jgi:hypothetical protein
MKRVFVPVLCFFGFSSAALSQQIDPIASAYQSNIPLNQETISGGYYVDPPQTIEGDPYFLSKNFEIADLTVNGITYGKVPLLYNIYSDEIITFHPGHKQRVLIKTEKINGFSFREGSKSSFIKIAENPSYAHHGNGFYEIIADGKAVFLCKHYKTRKEKREISKYTSEFLEKKDFWLQKGDEMRLVRKKSDVMEFLGLEKKELRQLAKERKLIFKSDKRAYILMAVSHFNGPEI